jgi:hypothetical protein
MSAVSLALAVASGCAGSPAPRQVAPAAAAPEPAGILVADLCPLQVPGARLAAQDVEAGVALAFTTQGDVADLRRRVRNMADLHGKYRDQLAAIHIEPTLPPADHFVEDVPNGARIVFRPGATDDRALARFRTELETEAHALTAGRCPIAMPIATTSPPALAGHSLATR